MSKSLANRCALKKSTLLFFTLIFIFSCNGKESKSPIINPKTDSAYVPTEEIASSFTMKTTVNGLGSNEIYDVAISSSGVIYAGTYGGLSISTDGGATFVNKTTANGLHSNEVYDVAVYGRYVICGHEDRIISISSDDGNSFTSKVTFGSSNPTYDFTFSNSGTLYIAAYKGLFISSDFGQSFSIKNSTHGISDFDEISLAENPELKAVLVDGDKIYVNGAYGLSISTNNGASFSTSSYGGLLGAGEGLAVTSKRTIFACSGGGTFGGGLWRSIDDGLNFALANQFYVSNVTNIKNIHVDEYGVIFVPNGYHTSELGISISVDDGLNFIHRGLSNGINTQNSLYVESVATYNRVLYIGTQGGLGIAPY